MLDLWNQPFIYLLSSIYHQHPFLLLSRRFSRLLLLLRLIRLGIIQGEKKESESHSVMSDSLWPHGRYSSGQNTGVGCHSLLQGIFPTQGSNPGLLHCRWVLYQLGSPRILEWGAYPFSSGSSWPRNQTEVSCFAGRFRYPWFNILRSLFLGSSDFTEKKKSFFQTAACRVKGQVLGFWKPSGAGGLRVMCPVCTHLPNSHTHPPHTPMTFLVLLLLILQNRPSSTSSGKVSMIFPVDTQSELAHRTQSLPLSLQVPPLPL